MVGTRTRQNDRGCVLAAIDMTASSRRVLLHASGLARLLCAGLRVLHVGADASAEQRRRVHEFCSLQGPYEVDLDEDDIVLRTGLVSEAIYREARKQQARLVVMGSRGHGAVASFLLGSTAQAVLRNAAAPVLLVPPVAVDIVDLADRARLACGPVLAAVDLQEPNDQHLQVAGAVARLAGQPLFLVTVAGRRITDEMSADMLRERAHRAAVVPRATIVRHGDIAEQIARCAVAEGSGLVVMGLRGKAGKPRGAIASAVLKTNSAFVLAVPEAMP